MPCLNRDNKGKITYNVDYDDGDFEDNVEAEHIKVLEKSEKEIEKEVEEKKSQIEKCMRIKKNATIPSSLAARHDRLESE